MLLPELDVERIKETAARLRANIVKMVAAAGSGRIGGCFSAVDIPLVSVNRRRESLFP